MFSRIQETINSNRFLLFMICGFLFPFFLLSAWNHPSLDDFNIGVLNKTLSFSEIQSFYYFNWSGRWAYTVLNTLAATSGFLYHYYWLFASFFLICTFFAFIFTINQVNRFILQEEFSRLTMLTMAALLLILELHVIPEIKTQFYWFTSGLTYQFPLVLFVIIIGYYIRLFKNERGRSLNLAIVSCLTIFVYGFNEMFSIFLFLIASFLFALHLSVHKIRSNIALFLYGANLLGFLLMFLSPGMWERKSHYSSRALSVSVLIGVGKFFVANWVFLKEPLWWLTCALIALWSTRNPRLYENRMVQRIQNLSSGRLIILYLSLGLLVYIPTVIGANGSLPARAENTITFLLSVLLLLFIHLKASLPGNQVRSNLGHLFIYKHRFILCSLMIFTTVQSANVVQSLASGYFYHKVMKEREMTLFAAGKAKTPVVQIEDYDLALQNKMRETFTGRIPLTVKQVIEEKPTLLFLEDYLEQDSIIKNVYGVERVIINRLLSNKAIK